MSELPVFNSPFLKHISDRIGRRRKAIRRSGKLSWETKQPDDFEWLTVYVTPLVGDYCIFQFVEDNRVSIFVRSRRRANRGKILLAIEDIKVIDNAHEIVNAMETTIAESGMLQPGNLQEADNVIRAAWANVEVRVANDLN